VEVTVCALSRKLSPFFGALIIKCVSDIPTSVICFIISITTTTATTTAAAASSSNNTEIIHEIYDWESIYQHIGSYTCNTWF
jgi:hypothetical protein